jgi:hypothetical protein
MKETMVIITENIMTIKNIMTIMVIIANRDVTSLDGQPGGPNLSVSRKVATQWGGSNAYLLDTFFKRRPGVNKDAGFRQETTSCP